MAQVSLRQDNNMERKQTVFKSRHFFNLKSVVMPV